MLLRVQQHRGWESNSQDEVLARKVLGSQHVRLITRLH